MSMKATAQAPAPSLLRYGLLTVIFSALVGTYAVHTKFALLTQGELFAYWQGRNGHFPFVVLPWSESHFGGGEFAMRLPQLVIYSLFVSAVLLIINRKIRINHT